MKVKFKSRYQLVIYEAKIDVAFKKNGKCLFVISILRIEKMFMKKTFKTSEIIMELKFKVCLEPINRTAYEIIMNFTREILKIMVFGNDFEYTNEDIVIRKKEINGKLAEKRALSREKKRMLDIFQGHIKMLTKSQVDRNFVVLQNDI
jgi:hypothetical protein